MIVKKCKNCHEFFPRELLSLEVFCPECNSNHSIIDRATIHLNRLKKTRSVPLDIFDVYDSDRIYKPYQDSKYEEYERVCRLCGDPLRKKNGAYSYHLRYCRKHQGHGNILYRKYNWGSCSKSYIKGIQFKYRKLIKKELEKIFLPKDISYLVVICEKCHQLCQKAEYYILPILYSESLIITHYIKSLPIINVHHKIPVHTLTMENIQLIWDPKNLICLCPDCHHSQDHLLSDKKKMKEQFIKAHKTLEKFI